MILFLPFIYIIIFEDVKLMNFFHLYSKSRIYKSMYLFLYILDIYLLHNQYF